MTEAVDRVLEGVSRRGWQARVVRAERVDDLRRVIEGLRADGLLDETFATERLAFFSFDLPAELPEARSLIVIAVPAPAVRLTFHWHGDAREALLPPTYAGYNTTTKGVQDGVAAILAEGGWRSAPPLLPLKTLAVRSGLAAYGRNNITYVPGMGSYAQLVALFSDLPCEGDGWREPVMLERCESCEACRKACRSKAIPEDRFLLRAERCLTYHNESARPFPGWIEDGWHHALMGCMQCQRVCPEDKPFREWVEAGGEFGEDEAALLLSGPRREDLPAGVAEKLARLELLDDLTILSRNLGMLIGGP
jgi:epoxyqueuosine reductase